MGSASASAAPQANPPFSGSFPAGQACSFQLDISGTGGNDFLPRYSNSVKTISAGTGYALTFTNHATGKSVSFPSNGGATILTTNPDGSQTLQLTGHNILILMPTDITKGPSTTLIVGRALINIGPKPPFPYDVLSVSGTQTDICALLT
jgi:hypothetical protein